MPRPSYQKVPREWASDPHKCDKCGEKLEIVTAGAIGALELQVVECKNGHKSVRYRLLDVGD